MRLISPVGSQTVMPDMSFRTAFIFITQVPSFKSSVWGRKPNYEVKIGVVIAVNKFISRADPSAISTSISRFGQVWYVV